MIQGMDITFEDSPWEKMLSQLENGQQLSAVSLLTVLDGENEDTVEEVFSRLWQMQISICLDDLPQFAADSETAVRLRWEKQLVQQGTLMESLDSTDPLRMYLEELAKIPAQGDIQLLAERLPQDQSAADKIMNLSLSRVVELACRNTGYGVLLTDLIQEGSIGLWEHLCDYSGGDISEYIIGCIQFAMTRAIILQSHATGVGQKLKQAVEDYRAIDEKLLTELGRNPTMQEIADGLHLTVEQTQTVASTLENARLLNRTKKPEQEELPQDEDQAVEDTAYFQMRQRIRELLSELSDEDAKLLTLRYGLEGGLPMDAQQVGARMGLTPEEVTQKETAALMVLRKNH